eukprot:6346480-Ditylum_brightwellii.AAC.1
MEAHSAYGYQMEPRHPTAHELRMIPIDWVDCHIEDLEIDDRTKPVQRKNCTLETPIIDPASV